MVKFHHAKRGRVKINIDNAKNTTELPIKNFNKITRDDIISVIGPNIIGIDATEYPCFNAFRDELVLFEMPNHCMAIPVSYTKTPINL